MPRDRSIIAPRTNGVRHNPDDLARTRLAAIVRSSADAIIGETLDGIVTDWNPAAERLYGYAAEEVIGRDLAIVIPAERMAEAEAIVGRARRGESVEGFETVRQTKDGRTIDVSLTVSPVWGDDGRLIATSAIIRDSTERRRLERELRSSEARYRALVEQVPAVVYEQVNDDRQTSTYFGPQFAALTGYSMAEIMDQPPDEHWHDFVHPDDRERVAAAEARSVAAGEPFRDEYRLRRKDGRYIWVRDACVPVHDGAGAVVAWHGVLLDITERVEAERALADSEARFRTAFANAPIGMALSSPAQEMPRANRALRDMLGYDAAGIIPHSLRELTHPDDVPANQALMEQALAGARDTYDLEKRYLHCDGSIVWAHLHVSLVRDERGVPLYFISQMQDITARKQAEAELRVALETAQIAVRTKSQFLAMMSHELRTPLQAVIGYADFLLNGPTSALTVEQREDVSAIFQGAQRMVALISQLLDLSRLEAGRLDLAREPLDLRQIIEQVRQDVTPQAAAKGLHLTIRIPSRLPRLVGDADRVRQIVLNLVGNAVKFTDRGEITIRVAAGQDGVAVVVTDTGIGIAPEALPTIFEEFHQADSRMARRRGGAGLGLAIARKLAEQMGGRITVESELGMGSTFSLWLPRASSRGSVPQSP